MDSTLLLRAILPDVLIDHFDVAKFPITRGMVSLSFLYPSHEGIDKVRGGNIPEGCDRVASHEGVRSMPIWLETMAPNHPHAFWYGIKKKTDYKNKAPEVRYITRSVINPSCSERSECRLGLRRGI